MFFVVLIVISVVAGIALGRIGLKILSDAGYQLPALPPVIAENFNCEQLEQVWQNHLTYSSLSGVAVALMTSFAAARHDQAELAVWCAISGGLFFPLFFLTMCTMSAVIDRLLLYYQKFTSRIDRTYAHLGDCLSIDPDRPRVKRFFEWARLVNLFGCDSVEVTIFLARNAHDELLQEEALKYRKRMENLKNQRQTDKDQG